MITNCYNSFLWLKIVKNRYTRECCFYFCLRLRKGVNFFRHRGERGEEGEEGGEVSQSAAKSSCTMCFIYHKNIYASVFFIMKGPYMHKFKVLQN